MCEQETNSASEELAGKAGGAEGAATVLIVDDDSAIIASTRAALEDAGYQVLPARSGQEALELFTARHQDIDLVILDLVMPRMSGEECLDKLLEIDPKVRVLGTSGYYLDDDMYRKIEAKVKVFVPKPIDPPMLLTLIKRILGAD